MIKLNQTAWKISESELTWPLITSIAGKVFEHGDIMSRQIWAFQDATKRGHLWPRWFLEEGPCGLLESTTQIHIFHPSTWLAIAAECASACNYCFHTTAKLPHKWTEQERSGHHLQDWNLSSDKQSARNFDHRPAIQECEIKTSTWSASFEAP